MVSWVSIFTGFNILRSPFFDFLYKFCSDCCCHVFGLVNGSGRPINRVHRSLVIFSELIGSFSIIDYSVLTFCYIGLKFLACVFVKYDPYLHFQFLL